MDSNAVNYYWCKIKHAYLYTDTTAAYTPYITEELLVILHHNSDTQLNETMNTIVSHTPTCECYSLASSLHTRFDISAGVQNVGNNYFWKRTFGAFNIPFDTNLTDVLIGQDKHTAKKRVVQ